MNAGIKKRAHYGGGFLVLVLLTTRMALAIDLLSPVANTISNDLQQLKEQANPDRLTRRKIGRLQSALNALAQTNSGEWRFHAVTRRLSLKVFPAYHELFDAAANDLSMALHEEGAGCVELISQLPPMPGVRTAGRRMRSFIVARQAEETVTNAWVRAHRLLRCRQNLDAANRAAHRVLAPLESLPENSFDVKIGWDSIWPNDPEWNQHLIWDNFNWWTEVAAGRTETNLTIYPYTHLGDVNLAGFVVLRPGAYAYNLGNSGAFIFEHPIHPISYTRVISTADSGMVYVFTNATHVFGVVAARGECSVDGTFKARIQSGTPVPPWYSPL